MRWQDKIDSDEVRKTIALLKPDHQLFEIRILGADKRNVHSGYFTDVETLLEAFDSVDLRNANIYITLHELNEALYSRIQHDVFVRNTNTTSDTEVDRYQWFFIDLDPVRPANISSSEEELQAAEQSKNKVKEYLTSRGFPAPVEAMSGNGYHLLYHVSFPVNAENTQMVSDCLNALAQMFNNDKVKVDVTNYNPSRICKLHGTLAQKGASTATRPHRMSKLLAYSEPVQIAPLELMQALAAEMIEQPPQPKQMRPASRTINAPAKAAFDLKDFLARNGITYKEDVGRDCQMYLLDECPFDHNHRNGDAKIFAYTDGAIAFKCHHNSCAGRKWQDVRLLFEPDAYDQKYDDEHIEEGYKQHKKQKQEQADEFIPLEGDQDPKPQPKKKREHRKLKTAEALMAKDIPEPKVFVGVGDELPFLVEGTCILSAKPKLGKSWLALEMLLAVANGEDFLGYRTRKCSVLYLDLETSESIQKKRLKKALKGRPVPKNFYLETETDSLNDGFVNQIESYLKEDPDIGIVVVDVFEIIRSPAKSMKETEYTHAYRDITPLNELAQKHHISIMLVCHDRKAVDPDDPFSNILGSTGLQGAASQMIVMFRRRKDDPIHISVKGKTIDGLPELNVKLEDAVWSIVDASSSAEREQAESMEEYLNSDIREAVLAIADHYASWKGRCSSLIGEAVQLGVGISEEAKKVGGFIHKHQGKFLKEDSVKVTIIDNGTGPKIYKVEKFTIDTIDEKIMPTIDEFEKVSNINAFQGTIF